ncbi:hypothetical protein LINPERHAP2_LOCUS7716 [Linum perenne]
MIQISTLLASSGDWLDFTRPHRINLTSFSLQVVIGLVLRDHT